MIALAGLIGLGASLVLLGIPGLVLTLAIGAAWRHELLPRGALANAA
jgi:hypothetical protein